MDVKKSPLQKYFFNKINPNKLSFSFTWDDNFEACLQKNIRSRQCLP